MAILEIKRCKDCKYYLKITHEYCYHRKNYGTQLENSETTPEWCPLKNEG